MSVREKGLPQKTLYEKLQDHNLNLIPMSTVKKLDEKTGITEEALSCPCCFKPVMTGATLHSYVQYSHYVCKHCEADLVFVAFSDHPEKTEFRFANLVMTN